MKEDRIPFDLDGFSGEEIKKKITGFIECVVDDAGVDGVIIGLSGGIDSTVSAYLAVEALNSWNVHGFILPSKKNLQDNTLDAVEVAKDLKINYNKINIQQLLDDFVSAISDETKKDSNQRSIGNIVARLRMAILYFEANKRNYLVLGTSNRTELLLGYFTKYGDGGVDLLPLGDLYKTEVRKLAEYLDIQRKIIYKQSTAGLWSGQTDRSELGGSYKEIDTVFKYIFDKNKDINEVVDITGIEKEDIDRYMGKYRDSTHKRQPPPTPDTYPEKEKENDVLKSGTITKSTTDSGLSDAQIHHLLEVLNKRPSSYADYNAREWTPELLQDYMLGVFEEKYSKRYIKRLLSALDYSKDY